MRALFDTNIYVSAYLNEAGIPRRLVRLATIGLFELVFSSNIEVESHETFLELGIPKENVDEFLSQLHPLFIDTVPLIESKSDRLEKDPSDHHVIHAALVSKADYIITGDHRLRNLKQYYGIQIVSPRDFWALLHSSSL